MSRLQVGLAAFSSQGFGWCYICDYHERLEIGGRVEAWLLRGSI